MNQYKQLKDKHEKQMNAFPMKFAFSDEQFNKAMQELGLQPDQTDQVVTIGSGGFIRKSDISAFEKLLADIDTEKKQAWKADTTGLGYIKDMFIYELSNHEYGITYNLDDTLQALGLTYEDIEKSDQLQHGLALAKKEYLEGFEKIWGEPFFK